MTLRASLLMRGNQRRRDIAAADILAQRRRDLLIGRGSHLSARCRSRVARVRLRDPMPAQAVKRQAVQLTRHAHAASGWRGLKFVREARKRHACAPSPSRSSVAGSCPRIFFWFGQMNPRR